MTRYYYLKNSRFPADAPKNKPNIVRHSPSQRLKDDDLVEITHRPSLCDFITTTLYDSSTGERPDAADAFFDTSVEEVLIAENLLQLDKEDMLYWVIHRFKEKVLVSRKSFSHL